MLTLPRNYGIKAVVVDIQIEINRLRAIGTKFKQVKSKSISHPIKKLKKSPQQKTFS